MKIRFFILILFLFFGQNLSVFARNFNDLNFDDLVELSKTAKPEKELAQKLYKTLNTPVINNSVSKTFALKQDEKFGKFIRISSWNVSRGLNQDLIKLIFTNSESLEKLAKTKNFKQAKKLREQLEIFKNSDILVLSEVDDGMPRTLYKNVAEELAKAGGFNYAYGVEFVEVDPAHLGLEDYKWSEERVLFKNKIVVDKKRYRGLHGNAILSKFPIKNARILRLPQYYDWYNGEISRLSALEETKRQIAEKLFKEDMLREVRHGSRIALIADIEIPGVSTPITVAGIHIENRTTAQNRNQQVKIILENVKNINNPVILAGDFNTMGADGSPTTIKKELKKKITDKNFIARNLILFVFPQKIFINAGLFATNFFRKQSDPTVKNIAVIAPNAEKKLFNTLEKFTFDDGNKFDFSGRKTASAGKKGYLGASNERAAKGFVPTFIFERNLGIAKYKLDWIFVKPLEDELRGISCFNPRNGRTLFELNYLINPQLSDHAPITVDLPLLEEKL